MIADGHELYEFAGELAAKAATIDKNAANVVKKGALNIKNDWRAGAKGIRHADYYPRSITYDVDEKPGQTSADIGPLDEGPGKGKQGFLGPILEFGGAHNSPGNYMNHAVDAEEPRFVQAIGDIGDLK